MRQIKSNAKLDTTTVKKKSKILPNNPRWNVWQGLFLLLLIYLIELP